MILDILDNEFDVQSNRNDVFHESFQFLIFLHYKNIPQSLFQRKQDIRVSLKIESTIESLDLTKLHQRISATFSMKLQSQYKTKEFVL